MASLPPADSKTRRPNAENVRIEERKQSDATADSNGENNRRKSNAFVNLGKRLQSGVGKLVSVRLGGAIDPTSSAIVGAPPLPPKDRAKAPPLPAAKVGKEPPVPPTETTNPKKEKRQIAESAEKPKRNGAATASKLFQRTSEAFKRISFKKVGGNHFDMSKALAAVSRAKAENEDMNRSDLSSPRFADLPSLLEFTDFNTGIASKSDAHQKDLDEDEERGSFIDGVTPKIKADTIIVLSFGEGTIKSGLASSEKGPEFDYPCLAGEPQSFNVRVMDKNEKNPIKFGSDAASRRGVYALEWFNDTENGPPKYTKVGDMMAHNSSHCLRRPLKQDAVIFPIQVDMPIERRVKMVCLAFERVGARAVRVVSEEKTALQYVTGVDAPTGIVLDIGHSMTRCVAIVDGDIAEVSLQRTVACGKTMTLRMFSLLKRKSALFEQTVTGMEFAREAKEKLAFAFDHAPCDQDLSDSDLKHEEVFKLTDGQYVTLGQERYVCAESLFQPEKDEGKLSYLKASSIQQLLVDCLKTMDRDNWKGLLQNVIVIGGGAKLPGLDERLMTEMVKLLPKSWFSQLKITVSPDAGWQGARQASLREGDIDKWINRLDWRQGGESLVQEKLQEMKA